VNEAAWLEVREKREIKRQPGVNYNYNERFRGGRWRRLEFYLFI